MAYALVSNNCDHYNLIYTIAVIYICLHNFYTRKQLLLSARLSHRNSVCPSVTLVDQSKTMQDRITKSLLSSAWKTLVSGTVRFFHKFEGGHSERGP